MKNEPNGRVESKTLGKIKKNHKKYSSGISRPPSRNEGKYLPKVVAKLSTDLRKTIDR